MIIDPDGNREEAAYNLADQATDVLLPVENGVRKNLHTDYRFVGGLAYRSTLYGAQNVLLRRATTSYDDEGQVLTQSSTDGTTTITGSTTIYDAMGRVYQLTDQNNNVTSYRYDSAGRLYEVDYPPCGRVEQAISFDTIGRVLESVNANGAHTTFTYNDPGGLLTAVHHGETLSAEYSYDSDGRLTEADDETGSRTYSYDVLGNPLSEDTTYDGIMNQYYYVCPTYNKDGTVASLATSAGSFDYNYDKYGRLTSLNSPGYAAPNISRWSYRPDGRLGKQTLANGDWTSYQYDGLGRLAGTETYGVKGRLLAQFSALQRDDLERLTGMLKTVPGVTKASGTSAWGYDTQDQLTGESWTKTRSTTVTTNTYGYDAGGNISTTPNNPTNHSGQERAYDAANRWIGWMNGNTLVGEDQFAYDNEGNPTTYLGTSMAYDSENHLTRVGTTQAPTLTAGYRSDGLRAWKQDSEGHRTYYLYIGTKLLAELDDEGNVKSWNTWGPMGLLGRSTYVNGMPQEQQDRWYAYDPLGNVALRLNGDGTPMVNADGTADQYDAWGNIITTTDAADPYGYKGQFGYYHDAETGFYLCTFRYYDPMAGRWLTQDPIGYAGGLNLYGYCGNGPSNRVDSSGLNPSDYSSIALEDQLTADYLGISVEEYVVVKHRNVDTASSIASAQISTIESKMSKAQFMVTPQGQYELQLELAWKDACNKVKSDWEYYADKVPTGTLESGWDTAGGLAGVSAVVIKVTPLIPGSSGPVGWAGVAAGFAGHGINKGIQAWQGMDAARCEAYGDMVKEFASIWCKYKNEGVTRVNSPCYHDFNPMSPFSHDICPGLSGYFN